MIVYKDLAEGERLTIEDINSITGKTEYSDISKYRSYYEGNNPTIAHKYYENLYKGIKPNKTLTSPYASTLSDTLGAYSFSEILRVDRKGGEDNKAFLQDFNAVLVNNDADAEDLKVGKAQIGIGVSFVLHWIEKTEGASELEEMRFAMVDTPENCYPIYTTDLKPKLSAFIYVQHFSESKIATVYYSDEIHVIDLDGKTPPIINRNDYGVVPVEVYWNSNVGCIKPLYYKVLDLIDLIDAIMTGQFNEVERFKNAILTIARSITPEDKASVHDMQLLEGLGEEWDKLGFITKEVPVEFQKFVLEKAIAEVHKHTGVLDFYDKEGGLSDAVSARAMRTRLLVMDMAANAAEKQNRYGQYQRIRIIGNYLGYNSPSRSIEVKYKRVDVKDFFDDAQRAVNLRGLVSNKTVHENLGIDPEREAERLEEEAGANIQDLAGLFDESEASTAISEE